MGWIYKSEGEGGYMSEAPDCCATFATATESCCSESLVPFASPYPIRRHLIYTPGYTAVFEKAVQVFFVGVLMEIQVVRMLRWVSSLSFKSEVISWFLGS